MHHAPHPKLPRDGLIDLVLGRPQQVIVLEAAAGMGKSGLLREIAERVGTTVHFGAAAPDASATGKCVVWDIPPASTPEPLPEAFTSGNGRIILAKRRETGLPGLARALAYGRASVIATTDLMFSEAEIAAHFGADQAQRILRDTGGWPLLVARFGERQPNDEVMAAFLEAEPVAAIAEMLDATIIFHGRVRDIDRRTVGGFARGTAQFDGVDEWKGHSFKLDFQNEFLMAERDARCW
jgi:hypothetical protein